MRQLRVVSAGLEPAIDGLDVALAYLRADGIDLMGYPSTPRDPACQISSRRSRDWAVDGGHRALGMAASGVVLRQYPRSGLLPVHDRARTLGLHQDGLGGSRDGC